METYRPTDFPARQRSRTIGRSARRMTVGALAAALCLSACGGSSEPVVDEAAVQAELDHFVDLGATGIVLVVRDGDRSAVFSSGVGNLETGTPIDPAGRFRIASLTKPYVATVVFQLAEEGRLSVDDTVEEWLPGLVSNGDRITIGNLLDHTSGIADYFNDTVLAPYLEGDFGHVWTPDELIAVGTETGPRFEPGAQFEYSNTAYAIVGRVVEKATGHTLGEELRNRIFDPLGLDHTTFVTDAAPDPAMPRGYLLDGGQAQDVTDVYPFYWGAGNIVSDAADVATFYRALLSGELVDEASLAQMRPAAPDGYPGQGLWSRTTPCGVATGHDGTVPGYNADARVLDGGREAVMLINSTTFDDHAAEDPAAVDQWTTVMETALCS